MNCVLNLASAFINRNEEIADNPAILPNPQQRKSTEEPCVRMEIYALNNFNGALMGLYQERRYEYFDMKYIAKGDLDLRIALGKVLRR